MRKNTTFVNLMSDIDTNYAMCIILFDDRTLKNFYLSQKYIPSSFSLLSQD